MESVVLALYGLSLAALCAYGAHRLVLLWLYTKYEKQQALSVPLPDVLPFVTVQLPVYNERFVVEELVEAVCGLDYPADRIEFQVLDDSTDETTAIAASAVERMGAKGHAIELLHRESREGYKAGALAAGLQQAKGELVAIFDADFRPAANFLKELVGHFSVAQVGCVQARWGFSNREKSLLTRAQALLLDGHFVLEQGARYRSGRMFNFNGTAGILRRTMIDDAGGWQGDTLTEDADLSYRGQLKGWRFVLRPDIEVLSELPEDITSFQVQQARWAKGLMQTAIKLMPKILRADLPWQVKAEAWLHLTANTTYIFMALLSVLVVPAAVIRYERLWWAWLALDLPVFLVTWVSLGIFYMHAERELFGAAWRRSVGLIPATMGAGIAMTVSNLQAVLEALLGKKTAFARTAKYGATGRQAAAAPGGWIAWVNLTAAGYFAAGMAYAVWLGAWASLPFIALFVVGYYYAGRPALRHTPN
jgi:cellulose synthase/poly-beta-1,6-N-acetylglucosamine synthase-like glycosyltransferase